MPQNPSQTSNGCLSLILNLFQFNNKDTAQSLPYRRKASVLTPAEHRFYLTLIQALENKAVIFAKVGLQDVFSIIDREKYNSFRNRIVQRHIDFLICDSDTLHPLFGVELDDSSHNQPKNKARDEFKNLVFEAALLPLIRIPVKADYDLDQLKIKFQPYFKTEQVIDTPPTCPNCNIPMVRRTAKQGDFKGRDFYACSNYPKCREIINIVEQEREIASRPS